jgi:pimeloyl-ACP methyl ester carboxylesterase
MLHERSALDTLALVIHREASERARLRSKKISHTDHLRRALDQLQIRVLMVWGEHDPTAQPATTAQILTQGHPNRRSVLIAGAGHWVQYERPAEINTLLIDWF